MKKVLIFAGTYEGRRLAELLKRANIKCDVAVATDYGASLMEESDSIHILKGRMDDKEMLALMRDNSYETVIDATHPFASLVTENIIRSSGECGLAYYRLLRARNNSSSDNCSYFDSSEELSKELSKTKGNILLTTGSKDLSVFCKNDEVRKRLIVRVLPGIESIEKCRECGLEGRQIIAMQGPFSASMNSLIIKEYGISVLVTKESGKVGGEDTKLEACEEMGIPCFIIRRPTDEEKDSYDLVGLLKELSKKLEVDITFENKISVSLCGMGMGSEATLTGEVERSINKADYIFGAKRLIQGIKANCKKESIYLAEDIAKRIETIHEQSVDDINITVLFSGDTGFYSACNKVNSRLRQYPYVETVIMPGISSVSMLSARLGVPYDDAAIVSLHGRDTIKWQQELKELISYNEKIFFLTSGKKDIKDILEIKNKINEKADFFLGYQLSYPEEALIEVKAEDDFKKLLDGLYVGYIENKDYKKRALTPYLKDDDFIRDEVPMTKAEIRHLSVCSLMLDKDAVVYDIGAGTGSVSIEIARLSPNIQVFAIEGEKKAVNLIEENREKFALNNISVIYGMAPNAMCDLPKPSHAFIGGSKGKLLDIIEELIQKNPKMRIVINAVSLETLNEILDITNSYPVVDLKISQVQVSHVNRIGNHSMMQANNPVFICAFSLNV